VPDVVIVVVIIIISIWFISLMVLHLNLPQHEQRLGPSSSLAEKMEGVLASHHRGGAAAAGLLVVFSPTTPSLRRINGRLVRLPPRGIIHNKSWRSESSAAPPAAARTLGNDNNASFAVAGAQVRRRNDKDVDPAPCYPEDLIVTSSHRSASRYRSCRPPGWSYRLFSTCNILHEIDLASMEPEGEDSYLVTRGFYRDVWAVVLAGPGARSSRNMVVLKTTRYQFDFGIQNLMDAKRDALVMERLASHPNIVDVHGHCGASTLVEAVPFQVEPYVIASSGYYHPERAGKVRDSGSGGGGLVIGNALEPRERLQMALEMAESLAVLHGYEGGTISHSDVQLSQWLRSGDDRLVLGDFHSSKIMDWNQEERQYCAYSTGTVFGNVRFRFTWNSTGYPS
jgi:serine/threonine protein kinase